jgi:hypothetical protein
MKAGDIVLVRFPQADLKVGKLDLLGNKLKKPCNID